MFTISKVIINIIMIIPDSVTSNDEKGMEQLLISMMTVLDGNAESIHKKKLRQSAQVNNDINECGSTSGMKDVMIKHYVRTFTIQLNSH